MGSQPGAPCPENLPCGEPTFSQAGTRAVKDSDSGLCRGRFGYVAEFETRAGLGAALVALEGPQVKGRPRTGAVRGQATAAHLPVPRALRASAVPPGGAGGEGGGAKKGNNDFRAMLLGSAQAKPGGAA